MMESMWHGKKILIMGLGLHGGGVAVARWFARAGARVTVTDLKTPSELSPSLRALGVWRKKIRFVLGHHRLTDFRSTDMVIQNPGVPRESKYIALARRAGVLIENEASLFIRLVGRERIIGVTGTRGKSTTAALLYEMVRRRYPRAILAGNIRIPMFAVLDRALRTPDPIVLELSSWHLEGMGEHKLSPRVAVVTNVLRDHLNRYRDMADYVRAKEQIWRHQTKGDIVVLNWDNKITRAMSKRVKGKLVWFAQKNRLIYPLLLPGEHNRMNAKAALAAARTMGISNADIRHALATFRGLPGRLALVRKIRGVTYINDTTATTPDATIAALNTIKGPIILIAGGSDKKLEYDTLAREILRRCKSVVLLPGGATDKILKQFSIFLAYRQAGNFQFSCLPAGRQSIHQFSMSKIFRTRSMKEAVSKAFHLAKRGDTILLSPGAASFGLFQHEFDRGDQFIRAIKSL